MEGGLKWAGEIKKENVRPTHEEQEELPLKKSFLFPRNERKGWGRSEKDL